MNPQQFQNLDMGRGMPMQMNSAFAVNPQQMGQIGGQQMPMQGMPPHANVGHPQIQKYIFTTLQGQGPFSGWQATVSVNERAAQVKLLVDSLRLVRPPVELPRALEVALQFERKCFSQSTSKEEYFRECSEKLGKIRDQRAQQMSQAANNMQGMQGGQMPNQNMQMQMGQNMMGQQNMQMNMPPTMQQMQQPQMMAQRNMQTMQSQPQMMQNQPSFQGQQTPQQNAQPKPNQAEGLSAEDNKAINLRAADLAKSTPKDKMRQIVDGMAPQLRHNLQQRGVDPIIYYFRMMATKEFRRRKAMEGGGAAQMQGGQTSNQQQPPTMNQATGQTPFLDRYQGLQGEGLRAQETGEMVVPASNNNSSIPDSMRITQQMLANSQRMGQQNPNAMNSNYLEQQRRLQQNQKMQQAARLQAESQQNARPTGSMPPTSVQNTPQGGTPLSAINRPVNLNVQAVSPQPGSRPASRTPVMGQQGQPQPGQQPMNMQEAQQRERILSSYPVQIQNILRQKPTSEWKATLQALQQNPAMQRSASQQPQNMQRQQSAQLKSGAFLGGANIGTPMQQSLSAGEMGPQGNQLLLPPNQAPMNPEMVRQRQIAMQQQQQQRMQAAQAGQGGGPQQPQQLRPLNPQQLNFMDNQPVPPNVLNAVRSQVQLPSEIATWINLKQWVMNNPIPNMPIQRVMQYQAQHFAYMMKNRHQAQQQQQQGQQPQQPPLPQQQPVPQGQMQNVPGQQAFPNQPQLGAPNDQDILRLRAQNPRLQNMTDDQVRQAIINRQRQQLQQAMGQQGAQRGMQQGQMPPQQQPQKQQPPPPKAHAQQLARPSGQATQAKPPQTPADKGVKRPNESGKPDGPAPAAKLPMQPQRIPNLTKEQYDALPQAKKVQLLDQQMVQRLVAIAKQVQSTMPKLQPVKMDPAARQKMIAKLTEDGTKNMVNRFDQLLLAFYKQNKDDNEMRGLIFSKLQLFSQYEQPSLSNKTWVPVQNFSITSERVEEILKDLRTRFSSMTAGIAQQQQRQQQPALLTPENLSRLQEQEDRKKSIKGGRDVPPAPTTTQPPFQFGDDRGHGAPKYAGTGLKQEDLKLDPKRRKKNPPGGRTPASRSATPPAPSPQITKLPPPSQSQVFRCSDPNCERNKQGFYSQAELIEHTKIVHQTDTEPVTDPIAFLDASLRDAFNLDENFRQIKKPAPMAPPMEKTASKASLSNLKNESKPSTPAAMSKVPSQSGRPQSVQLNKDDMELKAHADDWEHTKITLEELNNIFGDMDWEEAVPAAALELQDTFIQQYQQSEEWQKLIRTPGGSLTYTTSQKSISPPDAANKDPEVKTEGEKKESSDLFVDLEIDGLDLTGLADLEAEPAPTADTIMADSDGDSPFEILDKPAITAEQQFLLDNGIDYTHPEMLNAEQKRLMDFIVEPFAVGTEPAFDDAPWEDIDWAAEERQRQEDVRLGTSGAWNGQGFNRFP